MRVNQYPKEIVFVRHAESEGNLRTPEERVSFSCGTNFYRLTPRGREQAKLTGEWLREHFPNPDRIIVSSYNRARETADICYPHADKRIEHLLMEADRGIWHVRTKTQIAVEAPFEIDRRERHGYFFYRPIGGENWPDVERRVREFRRSIRENYPGKQLVIFGHATWQLLWDKVVNCWDDADVMRRYEASQIVANASVSIYTADWDNERSRFHLRHDPKRDYLVPWQDKLPPA